MISIIEKAPPDHYFSSVFLKMQRIGLRLDPDQEILKLKIKIHLAFKNNSQLQICYIFLHIF